MTLFELLPTATRTGIVAASTGQRHCQSAILLLVVLHNFSRRAALTKQRDHPTHRFVHVMEKSFEPSTEIVETWLTLWRRQKPIFGTAAVTGKADLTGPAVAGQRIQFLLSKALLLGRRDQLDQRGLQNIAQPVSRFDKVIAGIEIAVVFDRQGQPTGLSVHTEPRRSPSQLASATSNICT